MEGPLGDVPWEMRGMCVYFKLAGISVTFNLLLTSSSACSSLLLREHALCGLASSNISIVGRTGPRGKICAVRLRFFTYMPLCGI